MSLVESGPHEFTLSLSVLWDRNEASATSILRFPVRMALPPGFRVRVGADIEERLPYQYCDEEGCYAIFQASGTFPAALASEPGLLIDAVAYGAESSVTCQMHSTGFRGPSSTSNRPSTERRIAGDRGPGVTDRSLQTGVYRPGVSHAVSARPPVRPTPDPARS